MTNFDNIKQFCDENAHRFVRGRRFILYDFAEALVKWCNNINNEMKTIEEKAKRYDEAIEKAKEFKNNPFAGYDGTDLLSSLFPELKESDNEMISREITEFLVDFNNGEYERPNENTIDSWLSWLEKQGEQKLYVNDNAKEMFIKALERVEEQNNKGYKLTDCDKNSWWEDFKTYTSCTVEQKPSWSEEDVAMLDSAISFVEHSAFTTIGKGKNNVIAWLKSLKDRVQPQNTWKPSDEQIEALHYVANFDYGGHKATLVSLYEQLKKLKG